jgi:hypothetical protein
VIRVIEINTSLPLIFSVDLLLKDLAVIVVLYLCGQYCAEKEKKSKRDDKHVGDHAHGRAFEVLLELLHPPLTLRGRRNHDWILFFLLCKVVVSEEEQKERKEKEEREGGGKTNAKEKVVVGDDELNSVASLGSEFDVLVSVGAG